MTVNKIISSLPSAQANMGKSVANYGSKTLFSKNFLMASGSYQNFNVLAEDTRLSPNYGGWSLGTGIFIFNGGRTVFVAASGGGALSEAIVVNRGSGDIYVGINSTIPSIASGIALASGESYKFQDGIISVIWAITPSNSGILQGFGQYNNNPNLI